MSYKRSRGDYIFDSANVVVMICIMIATLYPLLHVLALSLNDPSDALAGGIGIIPRRFSTVSYQAVFVSPNLINASLVSVMRTVIGTFLTVVFTCMTAYAMLDIRMPGYRGIYRFFVISMFIGGGLIPTFLLYRTLGLYNNFLVYIIPRMFGVFNMILFRTYMKTIPAEMEESARLDGAGELTVFFRIMIPLSLPILATIGLWTAVGQWNAWQDTLFFTMDPKLETLQYMLMKVLRQAEAVQISREAQRQMRERALTNLTPVTAESIKMAITIIATAPIICVYPFLQRYFIKGIMIGAVKG